MTSNGLKGAVSKYFLGASPQTPAFSLLGLLRLYIHYLSPFYAYINHVIKLILSKAFSKINNEFLQVKVA